MNECKIIAICNQKGGVGKTTTAISFGAALREKGYRVLLVDCDDSNPSLTKALSKNKELPKTTITDLMLFHIFGKKELINIDAAIQKTVEGYDYIGADSMLAGITSNLNMQNDSDKKTKTMMYILELIKPNYDFIILDAAPALNTLSANILTAADEVIITTQAQDAAEAGIAELIKTICTVKAADNPRIVIKGLLITMEDCRTNYSKNTAQKITSSYSDLGMKVFNIHIPRAVKAEECMSQGISILSFDSKGKVAKAYRELAEEYLKI